MQIRPEPRSEHRRPELRLHTAPPPRVARFIPEARFFVAPVFFDRNGYDGELEELIAPMIRVTFHYHEVQRALRPKDPCARFFISGKDGAEPLNRDLKSEAEAQRFLETFGAVDLECLYDVGVSPDVDADYMVRLEGNRNDLCSFSAHAIPRLRAAGWSVVIDEDYPYQVHDTRDVEWVASVAPDEERPDWFGLELGVRVGTELVDLLPALLELLEAGNEGDSLYSLHDDSREVAIPVSLTHHVSLPAGRLRRLLRVVAELYEGPEKGMRFSKHTAGSLGRIGEVFAETESTFEWDDPAGAVNYSEALSLSVRENKVEPDRLQATLRPYQREGLSWLQQLREAGVGGILADDMGLGKTLQTIAHLTTEISEGRAELPCLVIAPTSLMGNWAREIEKFAPSLDVLPYHGPNRHELQSELGGADVVLTSYPILVRDEEVLTNERWHFVVLDEAHVIKNRSSQTHKVARKLDAEHRLCLTGTPVENHLGELYSLIDFLNPGMLGDEQFFRQWYRVPIEKGGDDERLMALHDQIAPFVLRRLKSEVATELPPKTVLRHPVELHGKQRELYEAIRLAGHAKVRHAIRKKGFAGSTIAILDALMKLRQLCCDPSLVKLESARFVRQSAKLDALFELSTQLLESKHRILIFSQFTSMLDLISKGLSERGVGHLKLTGASRDRQGLCDRFEAGEVDVFLISLKAGGTGLNLVSADTVIHVDPWWNPQAQAQATDRAYRIGQERPVFVYNLFVAGSVEERMLTLQKKKQRLADAILAGELPQDSSFSEDEVEHLLAPLVS